MGDASANPPVDPTRLGGDARIVEGLVTTLGADGEPHLAPMGPIVTDAMDWLWLRPFRGTATLANLQRTSRGVFHITDDVELIARAVIGAANAAPASITAHGAILADACRWYAFEVEWIDDSTERTSVLARVVERGVQREFLGFNRAKHAVLEAAILATRLHLIDAATIRAEFDRLASPVEKTGAAAEHRAFKLLREYVQHAAADAP